MLWDTDDRLCLSSVGPVLLTPPLASLSHPLQARVSCSWPLAWAQLWRCWVCTASSGLTAALGNRYAVGHDPSLWLSARRIHPIPPPPGFCGCLQDSHVKVFVFFGLLVFFVVSVTAVVTMLNADDQDGITEGLDFGWHKCVALPPALATALHGRCIT